MLGQTALYQAASHIRILPVQHHKSAMTEKAVMDLHPTLAIRHLQD
jgi:hypothetical protein